MSDTGFNARQIHQKKMVEFENPFNGEVSLIKAEDIKEWETKRELLRLRLVAWRFIRLHHI